MHANGSPAPEFESDDDRTHFLIRLPVHVRAMARMEDGAQSGVQSRAQSDQIIAALLEGPLSMNELNISLGAKKQNRRAEENGERATCQWIH